MYEGILFMDQYEKEIKKDFIHELEDYLEEIEKTLLQFEKEKDQKPIFQSLLRISHTLKGSS